jgi:hypothetical protein
MKYITRTRKEQAKNALKKNNNASITTFPLPYCVILLSQSK